MATDPDELINLETFVLVSRKLHRVEDLSAFTLDYRRLRQQDTDQFPGVQTRDNWEWHFRAWDQLRNGFRVPPPSVPDRNEIPGIKGGAVKKRRP